MDYTELRGGLSAIARARFAPFPRTAALHPRDFASDVHSPQSSAYSRSIMEFMQNDRMFIVS
jgi:hypothetical protein